MGLSYQTFKPSPALSNWVSHYWVTETSFNPEKLTPAQTCLPMGLVQWVIQTRGKHQLGLIDNQWGAFPDDFLVGLMNRPVRWKMFGESRAFGICISPEWFTYIYNFPLSSISDSFISVDNLDIPGLPSLRESLVLEEDDLAKQIELIDQFLLALLEQQQAAENFFASTIQKIRLQKGSFDKETLRDYFFLGDRQIQRLFKTNFGLSPKAYERVTRFSNTIRYMNRYARPEWDVIADELGYSDQAHLIREFKAYAGFTPSNSYQNNSTVLFVPAE